MSDVQKSLEAFEATRGAGRGRRATVAPQERAYQHETDRLQARTARIGRIQVPARQGRGAAVFVEGDRPGELRVSRRAGRRAAGYAESYEKKNAQQAASGTLTAPFSGIHGWYWENQTDGEVTVTLSAAGFYNLSHEFRKDVADEIENVQIDRSTSIDRVTSHLDPTLAELTFSSRVGGYVYACLAAARQRGHVDRISRRRCRPIVAQSSTGAEPHRALSGRSTGPVRRRSSARRPQPPHEHGQTGDGREGSGTAWQPEETPMYAIHSQAKGWMLMVHGAVFLQYCTTAAGAGAIRRARSIG